MSSQRILGKNKRRDCIQRLGISALIFFGAFAVSFFAVSNFIPATDSSATDMKLENNIAGQYININTLGNIDIDLTASPTGETSVVQDALTIDTNARTGYKIYVSTPEDAEDTALHHTDDSVTKTIPAISSTKNSLGKIAKNSWGYTMSRKSSKEEAKIYDEDDADPENGEKVFAGIPSFDNTDMIYYNTTPTVEETNTVDIYYGVNADTSMPSGSYQADVLYTAVAETAEWNASIAPVSQKGLAAGQKIIVATDIYPGGENPDYGTISVKIGDRDCTNITPMIIDSGSLNISCLAPAQSKAGKYNVAVSVENYHREYEIREGYRYIQERIDIIQNFDCFSIDVGEEVKLRDTRDNTTYRVKRLEDSNCWLMEDLHITGPRTLTPEDTDITTGSFTLGESDQADWCLATNAACTDQSKYIDLTGNGYTVLYNWYTATGGTGTNDVITEHATGSICPKGWHLPTGSGRSTYGVNNKGNDFMGLALAHASADAYNDSQYQVYGDPLESNLSGEVGYSGRVEYQGNESGYWTGTPSGSYREIYWARVSPYGDTMYFNTANGIDEPRMHGLAVRCVAAEKMSSFSCSEIPEIEGTKELIDLRTATTYTAVKAKDGKCWATTSQRLSAHNNGTYMNYSETINDGYQGAAIGKSSNDWCAPDETCTGQSGYSYNYVLEPDNPSYGTYYGFRAAMASGNVGSGVSEYSFCPTGWRSPTKEEWQTLYDSYGSVQALLDSPLNFEFAGYHLGSQTLKEGEEGYFWSSSDDDGGKSGYAFRISKTGYSIDKYNERYGFALRCISEK